MKRMRQAIDALAQSLGKAAANPSALKRIQNALLGAAHGDERPLIDLGDLCDKLVHANVSERVKVAAANAGDALKHIVLANKSDPPQPGLNGLGIYAPAAGSTSDWTELEIWKRSYAALDLSKQTYWDELMYSLRKTLGPPSDSELERLRMEVRSWRKRDARAKTRVLAAKRRRARNDSRSRSPSSRSLVPVTATRWTPHREQNKSTGKMR
jgi:hypothetical protein